MKNLQATRGSRRRVHWAVVVALGTLAALAPLPARSQDTGRCARVETPWPVVLPDGSAHEAGSVKLCLQQVWTPAAGLHEIQLDGTSIGLFMSRIGKSEGSSEQLPVVVFERKGTNEHHLVGYAWPDGEIMRTYTLHRFGKAPRAIARKSRSPLLESENSEVLLAALAR